MQSASGDGYTADANRQKTYYGKTESLITVAPEDMPEIAGFTLNNNPNLTATYISPDGVFVK